MVHFSFKGRFFSKVLLLVFSLIICFIILECLVRFFPFFHSIHSERFLLFSSPTFKLDENEAVRFIENEDIRSIAIYNGKIEYDVEFHTNNLGFIDHEDYLVDDQLDRNIRSYAFVGDSFTSGFHGGESWVPKLRDRIQSQNNAIQIYNLGISGAGIEHFSRLLNSVYPQLFFDKIVILALSDDFRRPFWRPVITCGEIRFCTEDISDSDCLRESLIAWMFNSHLSKDKILSQVKKMEEGSSYQNQPSSFKKLLKRSKLLVFLVKSLKYSFYHKRRDFSLESLRKIKQNFPNKEIHLIHLPDKIEVSKNSYKFDIEKIAKDMEIKYFPALKEHTWTREMFFPNDSHPNALGYQSISDCVSKYLSLNSNFGPRPKNRTNQKIIN